ncbi:MAG: hypothetical protein IKF97_05385 [Clostridia bacterium]|nr:hypothetical protein [Clostridia bacterium]
MEKKILKYIIIIIILIVIITVAFVIIKIVSRNNINNNLENEVKITPNKEKFVINQISMYSTMNNIINKYFDYIYSNNSEAVLNTLNENYIYNKNISINNVLNIVQDVKSNQKYFSQKIIELQSSLSTRNYFVYGYIINSETSITR